MYQVSVLARYRPFPTYKVSVSDRLVKTGIGASLMHIYGTDVTLRKLAQFIKI